MLSLVTYGFFFSWFLKLSLLFLSTELDPRISTNRRGRESAYLVEGAVIFLHSWERKRKETVIVTPPIESPSPGKEKGGAV